MTRSDSEVVAAVSGGDREAYAELVDRYTASVRAVVLRELRDYHVAEDVAQESFLVAYGSLGSLRDASKFGPWLLSIARRRARRAAQQLGKRQPLDAAGHLAEPSRDGRLPSGAEHLLSVVNRLPAGERMAVNLKYFAGYNVYQIAAATGLRVGTVTKQLSRARARMRKWLT